MHLWAVHTCMCYGLACTLTHIPACSYPTNTCSCTCKCEEGKPHDPEKLLHIWVAGLMIDSKGNLFLKQTTFFLNDRSPHPSEDGQGSFTMKHRASKSGRRQHAKGLYQNSQRVSKATVPLYKVYYRWIIVTVFPQKYLPILKSWPTAALKSG